eukprot:gene759-9011_t
MQTLWWPLVSVGNKRKNGKDHSDWSTRDLHKKCWKKIQDENAARFDPEEALNQFRQQQEQDIQNEINKFEDQKKITDQQKQKVQKDYDDEQEDEDED